MGILLLSGDCGSDRSKSIRRRSNINRAWFGALGYSRTTFGATKCGSRLSAAPVWGCPKTVKANPGPRRSMDVVWTANPLKTSRYQCFFDVNFSGPVGLRLF
jgi:hypothetical protein